MIKKMLYFLFGLIILLIAGFLIFVNTTYDHDYGAEYPVPELEVESDSALIERGRYLANGPAHCIDCHAPIEQLRNDGLGHPPQMIGGFGLEIPPGKIYAPNITPDVETGIGRYSDGELYRMLRYNIRPNGRATIDFMPFINMADRDIQAIIACLCSLEPIRNATHKTEFTFIGKMLLALSAIKPGTPDKPVIKHIEPDTTAEYGRYMAYAVANCRGRHTERDMNSGEYVGADYAGGFTFGPDDLTQEWVFTSSNLTPDNMTEIMAEWDEDSFIDRLQGGRLHETSPCPGRLLKG